MPECCVAKKFHAGAVKIPNICCGCERTLTERNCCFRYGVILDYNLVAWKVDISLSLSAYPGFSSSEKNLNNVLAESRFFFLSKFEVAISRVSKLVHQFTWQQFTRNLWQLPSMVATLPLGICTRLTAGGNLLWQHSLSLDYKAGKNVELKRSYNPVEREDVRITRKDFSSLKRLLLALLIKQNLFLQLPVHFI